MVSTTRSSTVVSRWAVSIYFAVVGFMYANLMARLPRVQERYELDNGGLSIMLLCISVGSLVSMSLTGWLIVRMGSRTLTIVGGLLFVIAYPLLVATGQVWSLYVLALFLGLSSGCVDISMNAQAVLVEEKMNRPVMSTFHAIFSAGMMVGAGAGALFTRSDTPLFDHLVAMALLSLLVITWAARRLIPDRPVPAAATDAPPPRWRFRADLIVLGLVAFCCMLGEGAMADWSTNYLLHETNANKFLAPFGLAAFSTAMMVGRLLGDRARIRLGDQRLLRVGALISFGGLLIVLSPLGPYLNIFGFFLVGTGLATIVPIVYSRAGKTPGMPAGMGISIVSAIGYAGFLIGPPVIGFIGDAWGLRSGLVFVLLLFALMFFFSLRMRRDGVPSS